MSRQAARTGPATITSAAQEAPNAFTDFRRRLSSWGDAATPWTSVFGASETRRIDVRFFGPHDGKNSYLGLYFIRSGRTISSGRAGWRAWSAGWLMRIV